jgi:hypothetical protein
MYAQRKNIIARLLSILTLARELLQKVVRVRVELWRFRLEVLRSFYPVSD